MAKLDVKAFGLALGILWSACVVLLGITSALFNWGNAWVKLLSLCYIGYNVTVVGVIIGAVWGFFDAFIGAVIFAWLYNKFAK